MTQQELILNDTVGVTLFGVGGAGGNAVARLFREPAHGMKIICANTDVQALRAAPSSSQIQLGRNLTCGLGAGARPEVGRAAAREALPEIIAALEGTSLCFVAAGFGGGTGTGAAPVIARAARERGILTIGIATKPFAFEGARRRKQAERGIEALKQAVDTLIVVPNDRLLAMVSKDTSMIDAFKMADQVLFNAVKGISDIITQQGVINVDFADAVSVMSQQGLALMGIGSGTGDKRALDAVQAAISSPLLEEVSIDGATGILVNVTGGPSLTLHEVNEAIALIEDAAHEDANIIFGYVVDEKMGDDVTITVIATGFERGRRLDETNNAASGLVNNQSGPSAAQQRVDADVPTYIRNGWKQGKNMSPQAELPIAAAAVEHHQPVAVAHVPVAQPVYTPVAQPVVAAAVAVAVAPVANVVEAAAVSATPRRGMISMLPPVEEEPVVVAAAAAQIGTKRGSPVHRQAAMAMSTSGIGEDDEYDIPAFLRRNAE